MEEAVGLTVVVDLEVDVCESATVDVWPCCDVCVENCD